MMFRDEHGNNLPTIRIQRIQLENFKNVKHGEVVMYCGKKFIPYDTKSDILGLYGQNGSGKTSLMDALGILKYAMGGYSIHDSYADCISKWADHSRLSFDFDLQYPDGKIRKVVYSFSIRAVDKPESNNSGLLEDTSVIKNYYKQRVSVYDENISMSGQFEQTQKPLKPVIDTSCTNDVFTPKSKQKVFINSITDIDDLKYYKRLSEEQSNSFIFFDKTIEKFYENTNYSEYFQVLLELRYYAKSFLFVVDTHSIATVRSGFNLPLFTRQGLFLLRTIEPKIIPEDRYSVVCYQLDHINAVLSQLIPSLSVELKVLSDAVTKEGKKAKLIEVMASRGDIEIPFRDESDGIKKLVSVLALIIAVFNDRSITVAIDEIDAGIYEFLLGEILQMIQDSGKGQLLFTSHNLRPLEVLNKEFICFTTTNPDNRYYRLKGVGSTNNLRNLYIREILMNDQDEELYKQTKRYKTIEAMASGGLMHYLPEDTKTTSNDNKD